MDTGRLRVGKTGGGPLFTSSTKLLVPCFPAATKGVSGVDPPVLLVTVSRPRPPAVRLPAGASGGEVPTSAS